MNELNRRTGYGGMLLGVVLAAGTLTGAAAAQNYGQPNQQGYGQQSYNQPGYDDSQTVDPPSRVARVSVAVGNVSIEPASVQQFNVAETNYPMTTGDRIYADAGANAEIQTGQLAVRMGQQTDLTVTAMTDTLAQFGLAQGSAHLRSYNIYQGEAVELDTPNVAVTVLQAGDVRVDVDPNSDVTVVRVMSGQVQVNGNGVEEVLEPGERMSFQGSNPVYAQGLGGMRPDGLDRFSAQRDSLYLSAFAADDGYVNPGTIGGEDLNGYGTWEDNGDYGAVWYPTNVAYDWQPYRNGHWTWVAPWGWTWIEAESWGFAPFHYGRWNRFGNRWGWIPGPPVVRPVYSPALVAFVGGGSFSVGVTAWFPLGPREVYQPWYQTSPRYINRVNVSNIYNRNVNDVRTIYNQRTVVNNYNVDRNYNYANREMATVAVSHDNFASGRRVDQSIVRVDPRQMAGAQVMAHPMVSPQRQMIVQTPARAMPPRMQRPVLASHEDTAIRPSAGLPRMQGGPVQPQGGPVQPQGGQQQRYQQSPQQQQWQQQTPTQPQAPVQQQQQPGRFQQGAPGAPHNEMYNPHQVVEGQQPPQRTQPQPQQPVQQQQMPQRTQPQQPVQSQQPVQQQMPQRIQPQPPVQQQPPAAQQPQSGRSQQQDQQRQPQDQQRQQQDQQRNQQNQQQPQQNQQQQQPQRQLFNRAVPPEPRPSFDQQRQVIEKSEPGKPLNQQQLNNLRPTPAPTPAPAQAPAATPPQTRLQARPDPVHGGPVKPNEAPKN